VDRVSQKIKKEVRDTYAQIARQWVEAPAQASCCGPRPAQESACCSSGDAAIEDEACCVEETAPANDCCASATVKAKVAAHGYTAQQVSDLPDSVTEASLGCGNPTAIASLQPGETVLDLGSGGGIDCFLAAKKVGPTGHVIGLDMTPDMIKLARRNATKMGVTNVDFRYGEMEEMPIPDELVDVIISNCVINLSPDKDAVFGEAFRVLKPGGRMTVSDIVTDGPLPDVLREHVNWAGCVAGALDEGVYLDKMRAAGLTDVTVTQKRIAQVEGILASQDVQAMLAQMDPPLSVEWLQQQLENKIASVTVEARKPAP
jgi:arsenite methyltransferase